MFRRESLSDHLGRDDRRIHVSDWSAFAVDNWSSSVDLGLRALPANVASLAAAVASLAARSVDGASVWRGAVTRDVAKLAASIALHSLGLAVACKVVWSSALVASSCASSSESAAASKAPARWSTKTSSRWWWHCSARSWAVALVEVSY